MYPELYPGPNLGEYYLRGVLYSVLYGIYYNCTPTVENNPILGADRVTRVQLIYPGLVSLYDGKVFVSDLTRSLTVTRDLFREGDAMLCRD